MVSGGAFNTASVFASTVSGGSANVAVNFYATVGGGIGNLASGEDATVGGGANNQATANYSTVPGGSFNAATGNYSFAAGRRAKANHNGSFVWADASGADIASTAVNQFDVRASGGVRIYTNAALNSGARLSAGGSSWLTISDSASKENITPINGNEILEKLSELPITRWNYKTQTAEVQHIGPMAQDFYRLFSLGEDDKHINTLDPGGVALAAIKALYEKSKRVDALEASNKELKDHMEKLEKLMKELGEK